jgi:hypothetical protein
VENRDAKHRPKIRKCGAASTKQLEKTGNENEAGVQCQEEGRTCIQKSGWLSFDDFCRFCCENGISQRKPSTANHKEANQSPEIHNQE